MKLLPILLTLIFSHAFADEDCVFNETAYFDFINNYQAGNKNSKIYPDGRTLVVERNNEKIIITGGGCVHLGESIELISTQAYDKKQFLQKTLDLSIEFGHWLINTHKLKNSIDNGKYKTINGIYFIEVDAMTVFEASYDSTGKISIDFYIN